MHWIHLIKNKCESHLKKSCLYANLRVDKGQVKIIKTNVDGLIQVKYSCWATSTFCHSAEASFLLSHVTCDVMALKNRLLSSYFTSIWKRVATACLSQSIKRCRLQPAAVLETSPRWILLMMKIYPPTLATLLIHRKRAHVSRPSNVQVLFSLLHGFFFQKKPKVLQMFL